MITVYIMIVVSFIMTIITFYNLYRETKEDYETYKQLCIYPWQIIMFIAGLLFICASIDQFLKLY